MRLFGRKSKQNKTNEENPPVPVVASQPEPEPKPTLRQRLNPFRKKKVTAPVQTVIIEVEKKPTNRYLRRRILLWTVTTVFLIGLVVFGGPLMYVWFYQPVVMGVAQFRVDQVATSTTAGQDFSATSTREAVLIVMQVQTAEAYQTQVMQEAQAIAKAADQQTAEAFEQLVVSARREVDGTATAAAQNRSATALHNADLFAEAEAVRVADAVQQDKNVTVAAVLRTATVRANQQKNTNPNDCTQPAFIFMLAFGAIVFRQSREV
ncbi:hypothetical protein QUF64_10700 [Anaerolineales bacterium HSG6]|nr:hypothetical protein [Anaerolineales bacterium HSG6]